MPKTLTAKEIAAAQAAASEPQAPSGGADALAPAPPAPQAPSTDTPVGAAPAPSEADGLGVAEVPTGAVPLPIGNFSHYPTMPQLLRTGGSVGITYFGVHPNNLAGFEHGTHPLALGFRWGRIEALPTFQIHGPAGPSDVILVGAGKVVTQADPANGIRRVLYDPEIETTTGLKRPDTMVPNAAPTA